MHQPTRMSPLTAFFLGLSTCGVALILSVAVVLICGMKIAEYNVTEAVQFASRTLDGLPKLLENLPPALADAMNDRRAPDYAAKVHTSVKFIDEGNGQIRPVLTLTNSGEETVSLLSLRVAALDSAGTPVQDWTEVVATPIAIDDDWRGPLMPQSTRYVTLHRTRVANGTRADSLKAAVEISDIRLWEPRKPHATASVAQNAQ